MTKRSGDDLRVEDTTGLTDADWAGINKLKQAYDSGGQNALGKAIEEMVAADVVLATRVLGAFFPDLVREAIKDTMAERGITEQDIRELKRKLESPAGNH